MSSFLMTSELVTSFQMTSDPRNPPYVIPFNRQERRLPMEQTFLVSSFVVTVDCSLVVTEACECERECVEARKGVRK